jgi:GNAT superfamily N-acetyltransferase
MRAEDVEGMVQVFDQVVSAYPGYTSFSELQEGVALDLMTLSPARIEIWRELITELYGGYPQGQFVAADGTTGAIVGFQIVERVVGPRASYGILHDMCVLPVYRGAGAGATLFHSAIDQLRRDGIKRIFFESGIGNTSFHAWAERRGFRPISLVFMAE